MAKELKNEIKYEITLDEEQKEGKKLMLENQVVIVTGQAGSGKSLVIAQTCLDLLFKKYHNYKTIKVTRALVEVGASMGFLPGDKKDKFNPYMEAFVDCLYDCVGTGPNKAKVDDMVLTDVIGGYPVQFIRGKTNNQIIVVEEAQNFTRHEMLAILTRLGKEGKIFINGDQAQRDTNPIQGQTGLDYVIELSKHLPKIKHIKLKNNHRSDLVGEILDYEYSKNSAK